MNIAFFLTPKTDVAFIYDDFTLRQALEKMRTHHYTAIPVINRSGQYVGTAREGDFLWYLVDSQQEQNQPLRKVELKSVEDVPVRRLLQAGSNPAIRITANMEELVAQAMAQNFIPVVDDLDTFIGIVTRKSIIQYGFSRSNGSERQLRELEEKEQHSQKVSII